MSLTEAFTWVPSPHGDDPITLYCEVPGCPGRIATIEKSPWPEDTRGGPRALCTTHQALSGTAEKPLAERTL